MIRTPDYHKDIVIDLMGQDGNAFWLLGHAKKFGKQLGFDDDKLKEVHDRMTESDYNHLVAVFDLYFGDYVTLEADEDLMAQIMPEIEKLKAEKEERNALREWIDKK